MPNKTNKQNDNMHKDKNRTQGGDQNRTERANTGQQDATKQRNTPGQRDTR